MKRTVLDDYVISKIRKIREEIEISQEVLSYMVNYRSNIVAKAERGDMKIYGDELSVILAQPNPEYYPCFYRVYPLSERSFSRSEPF